MTPATTEVTLDEVYRLLIEVREDVITLKATNSAKTVDDHEARIRSLEKWIWRASGISAVAGGLVGWLVPVLLR